MSTSNNNLEFPKTYRKCHFLDLPRELRDMIYDQLSLTNQEIECTLPRIRSPRPNKSWKVFSPQPKKETESQLIWRTLGGLLQTCQQISNEVPYRMFSKNTFRLELVPSWNLRIQDCLASCIQPRYQDLLQHLRIEVCTGQFQFNPTLQLEKILRAAHRWAEELPKLRRLTMSMTICLGWVERSDRLLNSMDTTPQQAVDLIKTVVDTNKGSIPDCLHLQFSCSCKCGCMSTQNIGRYNYYKDKISRYSKTWVAALQESKNQLQEQRRNEERKGPRTLNTRVQYGPPLLTNIWCGKSSYPVWNSLPSLKST